MRYSWLLCLLLFPGLVLAQEEESSEVTFSSIADESEIYEGLFDIYQNRETGKLHLAISADQIDQEFIYTAVTQNGVVEADHFRGAYRDNKVISIRRYFDRVEVVAENTAFYFDPDNALSRAADANISRAVLAVLPIVAEQEDTGELMLEADGLFLSEALHQVKDTPNPDRDEAFALGDMDGDKTRVADIRSYPENLDVFVEYVFENPRPQVLGDEEITDSRYVSILLQHSLIAMPDNDFTPRFDDQRVGYFLNRVTDLTSVSVTPWRDLINRWNLVKKDPEAEISDPVEPIVWWIENTTPVEYRDMIRQAALAWNQSFELAGFSNAIQVEIQPDDADWDAGDIRYNVLRWTSSPNPPFGGYGPSFTNPRTGEILGADIMLELVYMTNRIRFEKLFESWEATGELDHDHSIWCSHGYQLQLNNLFATQALRTLAPSDTEAQERMIYESMANLILHEIGHTLGLNHNMRASQLLTLEQAQDAEAVTSIGLSGSVMDYTPVHLMPLDQEQVRFYDSTPGPYDDWAIQFGYMPELDDPALRAAHLARSTEPQLAFGNDADDMRSAGRATDPRVNIDDMSSDPVGYAQARFEMIEEVKGDLLVKYGQPGSSWQEMYQGYLTLVDQWRRQSGIVSRFVGGVYVNRAEPGQAGADIPLQPVSSADQRRAMQVLRDYLFAPDAFSMPADLVAHLQRQRRDFDFSGETQDPKVNEWVLRAQSQVLDHLLHPVVQQRITESRAYGNGYPLNQVMTDLTDAIFEVDIRDDVSVVRQNLQREYVDRLLAMVDEESSDRWDHVAQATALAVLRELQDDLDNNRGNDESRIHRASLLFAINGVLES